MPEHARTRRQRPANGEASRAEAAYNRSVKQKYEEKGLQGLVDLGREQGYLTLDQVNDLLPEEVSSSTDLRSGLQSFEDLHILVTREVGR
jgi:Sigma-70 factor, region 1.1